MSRWFVPVLGLAILSLIAFLYRYDSPTYFRIVKFLMMAPFRTPFIDTAQIPAVVDCARHGVDVFVTAPCDPLERPLAYSPLWLSATFLPADPSWLNYIGLVLDAAFFLSLTLLPVRGRWWSILIFALATFSSLPAFALERGNMDVVMFVLIAIGGWFCARPALRYLGYPVLTLAGLLKFYPLVLFLLFFRERIISFILLCALGAGVIVAFGFIYQSELSEMAHNLPDIGLFIDGFGFKQMPSGIGTILYRLAKQLNLDDDPFVRSLNLQSSALLALDILCILVVATLTLAFWLATRPAFRSAFAALSAVERVFLVVGSVLICGCFFAGQNVSYRGIHFLFLIPGVVALASDPPAGPIRSLFRMTTVIIFLLLWGLTLQQLVAWLSGGSPSPMGGSVAMYLYWIAHELAWWWVISVLLGILFCFVSTSPVWQDLFRLRRRVS